MSTLRERITTQLGAAAELQPGSFPLDIPLFRVPREQFNEAARTMKYAEARLVSEWAADETLLSRGFAVYACYNRGTEFLLVKSDLPEDDPSFPSIYKKYVSSWRFERQMKSLMGVAPLGLPDSRPWIKHEDWPPNTWPLRKKFAAAQKMERVKGDYRWIRAEGEGVYEIPVGPVHAGIIEPGHFRFQAVGEEILNLEERLGYVHKGIEKRFEDLSWEEGARLAGRISGDTTVAHALCYCRAVEAVAGCAPPERALWLRSLMLERERIANHLGDIAAVCNDVAFAFLFFQFNILKERLVRTNYRLFGHRFLMDRVVPGGVTADLNVAGAGEILRELDAFATDFERLVVMYDNNPSLEDRVKDTGCLSPEKARDLGVVGIVARASGQALDSRIQSPFPPYDRLVPDIPVYPAGDVNARVWVRIDEIRASVLLIRQILADLPEGAVRVSFSPPGPDRSGIALVEGWRGEIACWVQSGPQGEINRCMVRDPSSVTWLGLEQCIHGNIVPDFPVCNKSFNASYSGHDL
ncbi:MAG TPA: NADH-quinone oxidoreductase subunit C [Geobacteraceae bacterium]|nr:NADH-quinone oxidoreductase subunit C [Geobacteraceae bacterium]